MWSSGSDDLTARSQIDYIIRDGFLRLLRDSTRTFHGIFHLYEMKNDSVALVGCLDFNKDKKSCIMRG
jgi:hypothetical protein